MAEINVPDLGDEAPDFALKGSTGELLRLSEQRGVRRLLLIFYPKDFTSG